MKTTGNVVLITGGSSGIGLALAARFLQADNQVIITGRNSEKLSEVQKRFPKIITEVADNEDERALQWLAETYSNVNILINNAGVQFNYVFSEEPDTQNGRVGGKPETERYKCGGHEAGPEWRQKMRLQPGFGRRPV